MVTDCSVCDMHPPVMAHYSSGAECPSSTGRAAQDDGLATCADRARSVSPARGESQAVLALCGDPALELPPGAGLPRQGPVQPPPPSPLPDRGLPAEPAPPDLAAPAFAAPHAALCPAGGPSGPEMRQAAAGTSEGTDSSLLRTVNAVTVAGRARTPAEETTLQGPAATGPGCAAAAAPAEGSLLAAQLAAPAGAAPSTAAAAADPAGSGSPATHSARTSARARAVTASTAGGGAAGAAGGSVGPGLAHGVGALGCSSGPSGSPGHPLSEPGAQGGGAGGDNCALIEQAPPVGATCWGAAGHSGSEPSHGDQLGRGPLACAPAPPHAAPGAPAAAQPARAGYPAPGAAAPACVRRPIEGLPAAGPACGGAPTPHLAQPCGAAAAAGCRGGDLAVGGSAASAGGAAEDDLRALLAAHAAAAADTLQDPALAAAAVGVRRGDTRGAAGREEGRAAAACAAAGAAQHAAGPGPDARAGAAAPRSPAAAARCQGVDGPDQARPEGGRADAGPLGRPGQGPAADPGSEPSGGARKRRADDSGGDGHAEREAAAKRARMVALRCGPSGRARACWAGDGGPAPSWKAHHVVVIAMTAAWRPGCVPCVGLCWWQPSFCRPTRLRCDVSTSFVSSAERAHLHGQCGSIATWPRFASVASSPPAHVPQHSTHYVLSRRARPGHGAQGRCGAEHVHRRAQRAR